MENGRVMEMFNYVIGSTYGTESLLHIADDFYAKFGGTQGELEEKHISTNLCNASPCSEQ